MEETNKGLKKEKECRYGHICTSDCQNTKDCPCLADHCCAMSEEVCDRTCDDCYWLKKDLEQITKYYRDDIEPPKEKLG